MRLRKRSSVLMLMAAPLLVSSVQLIALNSSLTPHPLPGRAA
jgi:hypothetical protein